MKRIITILFLCVICLADVMAQEIVSGTVVDKDGYPVPGARVEIVGRSEYAMTDIDGTFRIQLPVTARKVSVSYPGYNPIVRDIRPDMVIKLGHGWGANSSGYRGFFDLVGGFGFGGNVKVKAGGLGISDIRHGLTFGFMMTHGYQINSHLFAGLGFGAAAEMLYGESRDNYYDGWGVSKEMSFYSLNLPLYADVRWDFGLAKKTAPYVGLKIGYQFCRVFDSDSPVLSSYGYHDNVSTYLSVHGEDVGGFLFQPSIGVRTSLGGKTGMNIGLTYNTMLKKKLRGVYEYDEWSSGGKNYVEVKDLGESTGGVLMLNIGFDF